MAITRDQQATAITIGSGTSVSLSWPSNPQAGASVLVFIQCQNTPTGVVDNGTAPATFTLDVSTASGAGVFIYRANNVQPPGGTYQVTISTSTLTTISASGESYLGMQAGSPDTVSTGGATGTSVSTGSVTPAAAGGLAFGGFSDATGLNPETITFTGSAPQAEQFRQTNGGSFWCCAQADALTGSAQNFTWTLGDSVAWGAVAAAYSPAGSGGGGGGGGTPGGAAPSWDLAGAYTTVFADDFAGTALDTTKWQPGWFTAGGISPPVNAESPQNNASHVTVSGGFLNLFLDANYGALITSNPSNTGTAVGFQHSYPAAFEARIFIPGAGGVAYNWPAWWTDGQNWPATGEIDIVEGLGGTTAYHIHDSTFPNGIGGDSSPTMVGWHNFGCYWTSNQVKFYYDGVLVGTEPTDGFTGPQYMVLVYTVNGTASPAATMQVDWVRVWTPGSTGGSAPSVVTTAASPVGTTTATLNGTVNPNSLATTYQFEYGPATSYGTLTPGSPGSAGSGNAGIAENAAITGLTANTTYHFRLNATNSAGTSNGADQVFTTAAASGGGALAYRAAPAFANSSTTGATTWTVSKQAGTVAGDWIFIYIFGGTAGMSCTGFTAKPDASGFGGLLYRRADGSEASTFTISGLAGNRVTSAIVTVSGAAATLDPAVVATPVAGGAATSIAVPSVTLANSGDWVLWFAANQNGFGGAGFTIAAPAGFTSQGTTGALAANAAIMIADDETTSAGATGTATGTFGGSAFFSGVMAGVTPGVTALAAPAGLAGATGTAQPATGRTGSSGPRAVLASAAGTARAPSGSGAPVTAVTAGAATAAAAAGPATPQGTSGPVPWFPGKSLGIKIELLLNGTWTDITAYAYQRDGAQITGGGRPDWTSTIQPAQLTLTLNNRDGRFSPKNSSGAFFPFIARNTQLRLSVSAQSSTGAVYSGYRFWGEVSEWPPRWDPSGRDVTSEIVASGIWRRISQLQTTLGSAFTRYNSITLTGSAAPRCYWPMEDGAGSTQLVPFDSVAGTANATFAVIGNNAPSLAANTDFRGSDAIIEVNAASVTATVPAGGTATNNCTRFLLSVPVDGDSAQGSTAGNLAEINSAGTCAKFEVYLNPAGTLLMQLRNSAGALIATGTTTTNIRGVPVLVSCELTPSGGSVAFAMRIITQGAAGITESMTGTLASASVGAVSTVRFSRANVLADTAFGHLSVTYGAVPSMVSAAAALGGWAGEKAMDRFTRICGEMGIATETIGTASSTAAMGPQLDDHLADVLQVIEDTDCGLLYESRSTFGLGYRASASMANQVLSATLSYTAAVLDASLAPTYDDQLVRNNVTVTNASTGYTQQAILTAGAMSVLNPPSGVGNGYSFTRTVSTAADSQVAGIATFLLNLGTVDEVRIPVVTLKMNRASNAPLFSAVPGLRVGDYFQITNPPSFLTAASNIRQLVWGYSETLSAREWTISFNSVPETPWETGFSPGTTQIAQIPGGAAVTSAAPGAGGLGGIIANGSITPAMLSNGITVHTLGGSAITISALAPTAPNAGDIWIASATGLLSQWNGSAWIPFKFDASQTVQAGTIIGSNIAASAITSGLIAAGTVVAGIVDTTNVLANTYIATNAAGQFLAYDVSSPTAAHLVNSLAGAAGTDSAGNSYPKGAMAQQLALLSQSSAPPAFTAASQLYTSSGGRLRYLSESGNDLVLDRSVLDTTNHSMGTQTAAQIMSSTLSYLANEAQAGSEYEIEIDGTITTPSSTTTSLPPYNFSFFIDGSGAGINNVTLGTVFLSSNLTIAYCVRARLTVNTTGVSGTSDIIFDGGAVIQFNGATQFNLGNLSPTHTGGGGGQGSTPVNQITTGFTFDTTANHSLAVYGNWGTSTGTSLTQSAITYRTKKTRRN